MDMQLLGQPVKHNAFGKGIITGVTEQVITVIFSAGEKRFLYPEAFADFLTLRDSKKQAQLRTQYEQIRQREQAARRREQNKWAQLQAIRTMKIAPNSQAAFHISQNQIEQVLQSGKLSTGCYLSGDNKGQPRIPNRMKPNSACLLTALPESGGEAHREILGAMMVREDFWGSQHLDGVVYGHPQYRIVLPRSNRLRYWDYFSRDQILSRWGNVPFRHFANDTMKTILQDIRPILADTPQRQTIEAFYEYFCRVNQLWSK